MSEHIIVLSPGPANKAGSFDEIHDGTYLGGETRMRAAVSLSRLRQDARFILVGGCNIGTPFASDKVDAMRSYMQRHNPNVKDRLVARPSLPCTYHNLVAAFTLLHQEGVLEQEGTHISILTNDYHRPRTIAHAARAWSQIAPNITVNLRMPSAEDILGLTIEDDVEARYPAAYARRISLEAQGLSDIKSGTYTDSCFDRYAEQLSPIIAGHGPELLAPGELQSAYTPQ